MNSSCHAGILGFLLVALFSFQLQTNAEDAASVAESRDVDERHDILRYGIDSEVLSLLKDLEEEEDVDDYTEEILDLLVKSRNQELKAAAIRIFAVVKYEPALKEVQQILLDYPDKEDLIVAGIDFLVEFENRESVDIFKGFASSQQTAVAMKAVEAIGKLGGTEEVKYLRDLYNDTSMSQNVRASALSALGMLKDSQSIPFLIEIANDTSQERSYRWRACQALGEIGSPDVLPVLADLLNADDTILRTYAVRALAGLDNDEILEYLIEALRDSFWRVRLAAAETLGKRKEKSAIDILVYKATRDPEEKIRIAAIQALGEIGGKSYEHLREIAENHKSSQGMRIAAVQEVIENDLNNSFDLIDGIVSTEGERPNSRIFIEIVKALYKKENPRLDNYFGVFLGHEDVSVVLMALKGIEKNRFSSLKEQVRALSESNTSSSIKKAAEETLKNL